jgi:hypothetical protein
MALIGRIAIAMGVDTRPLKTGLTQSATMVKGFEATVVKTGGALKGLFAAAAAYGSAKAIGGLISAGSDLNETISKTQAVFGEGSAAVIAAADDMARAFGVSKNEFLAGASVLGGIFKGAGFGPQQAADMAVQFSKLAADVSSFANIPVDEALSKLRAGLTGEAEPLKSLGILINEDRVKAQAYAMGLAKVGDQLSEQVKVQARAALIMGSLADAQGDLAKTADGVANSSRGLSGQLENLAASIGTALLPIAQAVFGQLNVAVAALTLAWEESGLAAMGAGLTTVGSAEGQAKSIGLVQSSIMAIADGWSVVRLVFLGASSYIVRGLTVIVDLVGFFARGLDLVLKTLGQAESGAGKFFTDTAKSMEAFSAGQFKAFESGLKDYFEKPAASAGISDYFDRARQQIQEARDRLATPKTNTPLASGAGPKKPSELKFASAMSAGSQDAVNTVLRSRYGASANRDKAADATARNTAETAKAVKDLPTRIGETIARVMGGGGLPALGNF